MEISGMPRVFDMGIYWNFQKPFKERELKKMPYINAMA